MEEKEEEKEEEEEETEETEEEAAAAVLTRMFSGGGVYSQANLLRCNPNSLAHGGGGGEESVLCSNDNRTSAARLSQVSLIARRRVRARASFSVESTGLHPFTRPDVTDVSKSHTHSRSLAHSLPPMRMPHPNSEWASL